MRHQPKKFIHGPYCSPKWPYQARFYGPEWAARFGSLWWSEGCNFCAVCEMCKIWLEDPEIYNDYRPDYFNEDNRVDQEYIKTVYCRAFGLTAVGMPDMCLHDYELYKDGKLAEVMEAKRRHIPSNKYHETMITEYQVQTCVKAATGYGVPFNLVIRFNDCIKYATVYHPSTGMILMRLDIAGRRDRTIKEAEKPHFFIGMDKFLLLDDIPRGGV